MKNREGNEEIGLFVRSYPSFICVYPVHLRFNFYNFLLKLPVLTSALEYPHRACP
jgi:hypothetical protein